MSSPTERMSFSVLLKDSREPWNEIADESIRTCITSPPYWGLRDYGQDKQIGQEATPDEYITSLVSVFANVKKKLTKDGTLWINIGDSYVGTGSKGSYQDPKNKSGRNGQVIALNNKVAGLKPKDMIGLPWKLAFALQADGWYLRSDIIWKKGNSMPAPVKDRPISSYEHIFLLSKTRTYFYDYEAVKEDTLDGERKRSLRDVWTVNTKPYAEAHFAVYPKELILPCILAGSEVGDTVLDPFSGSATTGVGAVELGRNYVGLESSAEYIDLSHRRFEKENLSDIADFIRL